MYNNEPLTNSKKVTYLLNLNLTFYAYVHIFNYKAIAPRTNQFQDVVGFSSKQYIHFFDYIIIQNYIILGSYSFHCMRLFSLSM